MDGACSGKEWQEVAPDVEVAPDRVEVAPDRAPLRFKGHGEQNIEVKL